MPTVHYVKRRRIKQCGSPKWRITNGNTVQPHDNASSQKDAEGTIVASNERTVTVAIRPGENTSSLGALGENNVSLQNTSNSERHTCTAAAAGVSNLIRKSDEIIWVQIGKTEHPAYELINADNPCETGNTTWVEWTINGKKESISKHQIMRNGLQARKRHRPEYLSHILADANDYPRLKEEM